MYIGRVVRRYEVGNDAFFPLRREKYDVFLKRITLLEMHALSLLRNIGN